MNEKLQEWINWTQYEELVDWIALQGVKIYDAWKAVGAV